MALVVPHGAGYIVNGSTLSRTPMLGAKLGHSRPPRFWRSPSLIWRARGSLPFFAS